MKTPDELANIATVVKEGKHHSETVKAFLARFGASRQEQYSRGHSRETQPASWPRCPTSRRLISTPRSSSVQQHSRARQKQIATAKMAPPSKSNRGSRSIHPVPFRPSAALASSGCQPPTYLRQPKRDARRRDHTDGGERFLRSGDRRRTDSQRSSLAGRRSERKGTGRA